MSLHWAHLWARQWLELCSTRASTQFIKQVSWSFIWRVLCLELALLEWTCEALVSFWVVIFPSEFLQLFGIHQPLCQRHRIYFTAHLILNPPFQKAYCCQVTSASTFKFSIFLRWRRPLSDWSMSFHPYSFFWWSLFEQLDWDLRRCNLGRLVSHRAFTVRSMILNLKVGRLPLHQLKVYVSRPISRFRLLIVARFVCLVILSWLAVWLIWSNFTFIFSRAPIIVISFCGQVLPLTVAYFLLHVSFWAFTVPDYVFSHLWSSTATSLAAESHRHRSYLSSTRNCWIGVAHFIWIGRCPGWRGASTSSLSLSQRHC